MGRHIQLIIYENKPIDFQNSQNINPINFEDLQNFSENEKNAYDRQKFIVDLENSNFNNELSFNLNSNSSYSILIGDNINNNNDMKYLYIITIGRDTLLLYYLSRKTVDFIYCFQFYFNLISYNDNMRR